jgi:hypothetical protein
MTNDEIRMTNEKPMTNDETRLRREVAPKPVSHVCLVIAVSSFTRHSDFVIRHSAVGRCTL